MNPRFFPTVMMALDIATSAVWYANGDIRKAVYWVAAAILTATVTY
jgi:hypothetical protein